MPNDVAMPAAEMPAAEAAPAPASHPVIDALTKIVEEAAGHEAQVAEILQAVAAHKAAAEAALAAVSRFLHL